MTQPAVVLTAQARAGSPPHAFRVFRGLVVVLVGLGIWVVPGPVGIDPRAWHLLAIFVATIVGLVVQPLPMGAVALIGLTVTVLTGTLTIGEALSGFSNRVVWLVIAAFFIASGVLKTGLGMRIGYLLIAAFGGRPLGLGYSLVAADLALAPAIPSNTARAGGIIFPILRSVADRLAAQGSAGQQTYAFLTLTAFQGTVITSAMFLTAMVANPLAAQLAADLGVQISWRTWALAALVPGVCSLIVVPLVIYRLCPPDTATTPGASLMARTELARLGRMTRRGVAHAGRAHSSGRSMDRRAGRGHRQHHDGPPRPEPAARRWRHRLGRPLPRSGGVEHRRLVRDARHDGRGAQRSRPHSLVQPGLSALGWRA